MNAARAWGTALVVLAVAGAFLPSSLQSSGAQALLLLAAAMALGFAIGRAGQPSLGQGAFAGAGAYVAAIARRHGWDPVSAVLVATAVAAIAGVIVATVVSRLRPAFVAVVTWLVAWSFSIALRAFPSLFGGAAGIVVPPARFHLRALGLRVTAGPVALFEIALVVLALTVSSYRALAQRFGPALALARTDAPAARAAGVDVERMRRIALVYSAVVAGLAGAVFVQVAGVADPTTYGPLLSVELFVVVLLGGAEHEAGPAAGLVALLVISRLANAFGHAVGIEGSRVEPLVAGAALLAVLATGGGVVPLIRRLYPRNARGWFGSAEPLPRFHGAPIEARGLRVSFGGVVALDGIDLAVPAGSCHAIIGPNGSGKSTALRALSGAVGPDEGTIVLAGRDVTDQPMRERVAAGLARTLQRSVAPAGVTAREVVLAGLEPDRDASVARALMLTPRMRTETRQAADWTNRILSYVGVHPFANVETLSGLDQRLIQIARAIASRPRVLLLDEPSAGLGGTDEARLRDVIGSITQAGLTVVLVEHNLRLVRALAGEVTVLDAGRVIARGSVGDVAADAEVQRAYLGVDTMRDDAKGDGGDPDPARGVLERHQRETGRKRSDRRRRPARPGRTHRAANPARSRARRGSGQRKRRRGGARAAGAARRANRR